MFDSVTINLLLDHHVEMIYECDNGNEKEIMGVEIG